MDSKIHEFDPQIYPRKIWIAVGVSTSVLNETFEGIDDMDESTDALVINTRKTKPDIKAGVLIRFKNRNTLTASIIAHEAVHAALEIFDYVEARIDAKNQEPFAYLVG